MRTFRCTTLYCIELEPNQKVFKEDFFVFFIIFKNFISEKYEVISFLKKDVYLKELPFYKDTSKKMASSVENLTDLCGEF